MSIYATQIDAAEAKDSEILAAEAHLKALREARRESRRIVYHSTKRICHYLSKLSQAIRPN